MQGGWALSGRDLIFVRIVPNCDAKGRLFSENRNGRGLFLAALSTERESFPATPTKRRTRTVVTPFEFVCSLMNRLDLRLNQPGWYQHTAFRSLHLYGT
jgi:hypothetical protein